MMSNYLIDITRFISRVGRGKPTGIDRVEIAYIREISERDPNSLAVAKLGKEYVLLPAKAVAEAVEIIEADGKLGRDGPKDFFRLKLSREQRQARQYFRSVSLKQAANAGDLFAGRTLSGTEYVNVGHSNLGETFLAAVKTAGCTRISIMIHDMIPLDFPEFTRAGIAEQFAMKMKTAVRLSDRIICNSADTEARVKHYASQWDLSVATDVAHLGVEPMKPVTRDPSVRPYFVCLGTIEPRKNHALLFKVWERLTATLPADQVPALHIIGKRGWKNEDVFQFLDTSPLMDEHIFEHSDANDAVLERRLANSSGLLFPSHAEGFGLPALEAAQVGIPVICSDLPVFHEILEGHATFVDTGDTAAWADVVQSVAEMTRNGAQEGKIAQLLPSVPRWESHFCHVFRDTETNQVVHE